jgi:hypothetical protein
MRVCNNLVFGNGCAVPLVEWLRSHGEYLRRRPMRKPKALILCIIDDDFGLDTRKELLQGGGYEVLTAIHHSVQIEGRRSQDANLPRPLKTNPLKLVAAVGLEPTT